MEERYEGLFLLDPELSDEALGNVRDRIVGEVSRLGGTVERQQSWGKRRLAYRVRRRREGFYVLLVFTMKPEGFDSLGEWCALQEPILRRLILRVRDDLTQPVEAATSHGSAE